MGWDDDFDRDSLANQFADSAMLGGHRKKKTMNKALQELNGARLHRMVMEQVVADVRSTDPAEVSPFIRMAAKQGKLVGAGRHRARIEQARADEQRRRNAQLRDEAYIAGAQERYERAQRLATTYADSVQSAGIEMKQHDMFKPTPAQSGLKKKGSTMKSRNELLNLALSVSHDVVSVVCVFSKTAPKLNNQLTQYQYKCPQAVAKTLRRGDMVLVESIHGKADAPLAVAFVQAVDEDFSDILPDVVYAWVISKIDAAPLERLKEFDLHLTTKLHTAQKRHIQRTTLAALMGDSGEFDIPRLNLPNPVAANNVRDGDVVEDYPFNYPEAHAPESDTLTDAFYESDTDE